MEQLKQVMETINGLLREERRLRIEREEHQEHLKRMLIEKDLLSCLDVNWARVRKHIRESSL